jgi:hypothetical protein
MTAVRRDGGDIRQVINVFPSGAKRCLNETDQ